MTSADISGLIGQYAHGNEPSHHIIHMYNYVDQPYKTQELVDSVLHTLYFNDPNGLSGNEIVGRCLHGIFSMQWDSIRYVPVIRYIR